MDAIAAMPTTFVMPTVMDGHHHTVAATANGVDGERLVAAPRNKGVICKLYFATQHCNVGNCPYAHVADGEARPLPDSVCMFFAQNACLRDNCRFFHGTKNQLRLLKESGATTYRPQDFMLVRNPLVLASSLEGQQLLLPRAMGAPLLGGAGQVAILPSRPGQVLAPGPTSQLPLLGMPQPMYISPAPQHPVQQQPMVYYVPQPHHQPQPQPQPPALPMHPLPHGAPPGQPVLMAVAQPDGTVGYQYVLLAAQ